ncbi:MAG: hypothetical protein K9M49_07470 [Candidatus Marinimicrobia bacterium]|nr:hypothetical protein [Candidatus Neomarinimicrobiota bacterium]MCF7850377.1 hypothetical protein [Candidatus Neomarinimicrobiota bacterium]MCF7904979.1 hypothetical protein [Candidatus Neomarinimicrobiota bacterium]
MDFLEFLMAEEIVGDIDFFDESLFGDEFQSYEDTDFDDPDLPDTEADVTIWDKDPDILEQEWGEDQDAGGD